MSSLSFGNLSIKTKIFLFAACVIAAMVALAVYSSLLLQGNIGKIDALLTAATLMRSWALTLWTFWQNAAQLSIYGPQANTLVDNAGVVQVFGARNHRMAQDIANLIGGISPEEILRLPSDEQILLVESKAVRCKQVRHYSDKIFDMAKS